MISFLSFIFTSTGHTNTAHPGCLFSPERLVPACPFVSQVKLERAFFRLITSAKYRVTIPLSELLKVYETGDKKRLAFFLASQKRIKFYVFNTCPSQTAAKHLLVLFLFANTFHLVEHIHLNSRIQHNRRHKSKCCSPHMYEPPKHA